MLRIAKIRMRSNLLLGTLVLTASAAVSAIEIREVDGSNNNLTQPGWGNADAELLRLLPAAYADGFSEPRGGAGVSSLPSARAISNGLAAQSASLPNAAGVSSWLWQWGQFLDHDLDLTGGAAPVESFNIAVPLGDPQFDPAHTGTQEIHLERSLFTLDGSGVRQQVNQITAFIDGSNVYGSDAVRQTDLRALDGSGKLRTSLGNNGEVLLPFNTSGLDNAMVGPGAAADFFIAGDVRANEQIGLTAAHTLFVREHNRLADEIKTRLDSLDPLLVTMRDNAIAMLGNGINSEGDFIYEAVRKVVGAQIQKITYEEFIPSLLGANALPLYTGYDSAVNPGISNEFSTAAFRVGHTMLPTHLLRSHDLDPNGALAIALRDAFFNPQEIIDNGIDTLLIGMLIQPAQEVDNQIVDDVRNFLFGPPGAGGFDLASLNIQRGRDHGLASYNDYRDFLGLGRALTFLDITGGNQALADLFNALYGGDVDAVDLWVGGLAEAHYNGGMVGETFWHILVDQFARLRDGDRFAYLHPAEMEELLVLDPLFQQKTHLNDIIERNTHYAGMPENMFLLQAKVPAPGTLALLILGMLGLAVRFLVLGKL